jgi:DNA-binding CsgD family transcriptional regulator
MNAPDKLHEQIISQLYEGTLDNARWHEALHGIAKATDSAQVAMLVLDTRNMESSSVENENVNGSPGTFADDYNAYYGKHDPAVAFVSSMRTGHWWHDSQCLGAQALQRSEFHQDFMRRYGLFNFATTRVLQGDGLDAFFSLTTHYGQADFATADLEIWRQVFIPHVQRAVRIRAELQRMAHREGLASVALNQLRTPMFVLDETSAILKTNISADALMRRLPQQLPVQHGRLQPQGMKSGQFQRLLQSACGLNGPAQAGAGWLKNIDTKNSETLHCLMLPLPAASPQTKPWARPLALMLLRPTNAQHSLQQHLPLLQQFFDLTVTETQVALALCQGQSPTNIAQNTGTSITTVRFHLRALFAKTGTTGQTDLIRLLMPLLA